jgi:hypothetical protein
MVETAAHLTDHVFPRLPVPQWVRYFLQRDGAVLNMVLRIFLRGTAQSLQAHSPGALSVDKAALQIDAIAFIHRFGSSLNRHEHFKVAWSLACQDRWTSRKRVFVAASKRCRPVPDFSAAKVGTMIQSRWNQGLLDGTLPSTDGHHFMASTAGIGLAFQ